jgi:hypothetical protein
LVISKKLQLIHVDLKAAHTESGMLHVPLFDHAFCPFAGVHFKVSKGFGLWSISDTGHEMSSGRDSNAV